VKEQKKYTYITLDTNPVVRFLGILIYAFRRELAGKYAEYRARLIALSAEKRNEAEAVAILRKKGFNNMNSLAFYRKFKDYFDSGYGNEIINYELYPNTYINLKPFMKNHFNEQEWKMKMQRLHEMFELEKTFPKPGKFQGLSLLDLDESLVEEMIYYGNYDTGREWTDIIYPDGPVKELDYAALFILLMRILVWDMIKNALTRELRKYRFSLNKKDLYSKLISKPSLANSPPLAPGI